MTSCWQHEAADRPSFGDIHRQLQGLLESESEYLALVDQAAFNPDDENSDSETFLCEAQDEMLS